MQLAETSVAARAGSERMPLRLRVVRAIASVIALAVLMLVIADWGWRWFGPHGRAAPPLTQTTQTPADTIGNTSWFGARVSATPSSPASTTPLRGDAHLLGTISGRDGRGYALFRLADRGPVLVAVGQELAPGVKVEAIPAHACPTAARSATSRCGRRAPSP